MLQTKVTGKEQQQQTKNLGCVAIKRIEKLMEVANIECSNTLKKDPHPTHFTYAIYNI